MRKFYPFLLKNILTTCSVVGWSYLVDYNPVFAQGEAWETHLKEARNPKNSNYVSLEQYKKALMTGGTSLDQKPEVKIALLEELGTSFVKSNDLRSAIQHYKQAQELRIANKKPDIGIHELIIANLERCALNTQEARVRYEKILKDPNTASLKEDIIIGLIFTEYIENNPTKLKEYINEFHKINRNSPLKKAFQMLSEVMYANTFGKKQSAEHIESIASNNQNDVKILLVTAMAFDKQDNIDLAAKYYNKVAEKITEKLKNQDNKNNFEDRYLRIFSILEKANMFMRNYMFGNAEESYKKLLQEGVNSPVVTLLHILAEMHKINKSTIDNHQFNKIGESCRKNHNQHTIIMLDMALKYCLLGNNHEQQDLYNIWNVLLGIAETTTNKNIKKHNEILLKLYEKTKNFSKLTQKLEELIKNQNRALKWTSDEITYFEKWKKSLKNIDKTSPSITLKSPISSDELARGGGERQLSEEIFDIRMWIWDNEEVQRVEFNGGLLKESGTIDIRTKEFIARARFKVEEGKEETFTITAYDKAGNKETKQIPIKRVRKQILTPSQNLPPTLSNKSLNKDLIGKQILVLVATDDYDHWHDLNNPKKDVKDFEAKMREKYRVDSVIYVFDKRKDEFYDIFNNKLMNMKFGKHDQLLIVIAGHGGYQNYPHQTKNGAQGRGYLVAKDTKRKEDDPSFSSFVSYDDFKNIVGNINCDRKMIFLDVCFGGTIGENLLRGNNIPLVMSDIERANAFLAEQNNKYNMSFISSGGIEPVFDGIAGDNSPYMKLVLKALDVEGNVFGILTADEIWNAIINDKYSELKTKPSFSHFGHHVPGSTFLFYKK